MRLPILVGLALCLSSAPAAAQFSAYYAGTLRVDGKDVPCSTQFSVDKGRVAAIFRGARGSRMLFTQKDGLLRVVDDATRTWLVLDRKQLADLGGAAEQMQKQLAAMPAAQREMAESMVKGALAGMTAPVPETYVWSTEHQQVLGYDCTRVDVMRGDVKRAEYWGTPSPDFKLGDAEHEAVLAMQGCLRDFVIMVTSTGGGGGAEPRPFQWDTSVDGFPLISRCFDGDVRTLDLTLARFDRKPLAVELFAIPDGYKKQDLGGGLQKGHGKHAPAGEPSSH
jgi:hypothetical protein